MRLKAVGIAAGIVISTAAAAENADWFGERLFDTFADDLRSPAYEAPGPDASPQQRRIPPAPFDSPPFPSADWQIGGTPIIGDANNIAPWPLMEAIYAGPNGDAARRNAAPWLTCFEETLFAKCRIRCRMKSTCWSMREDEPQLRFPQSAETCRAA